MCTVWLVLYTVAGLAAITLTAVADYKESWGYIEVKDGGFMFWWLYHKPANGPDRPIILWLAGGPGTSSCAYSNFAEVGPLDFNLKRNPQSWISEADLLFLDTPVGTGYSYVTKSQALCASSEENAADIEVFLRQWMRKIPEFKTRPLWIWGESYAAKYAAVLAYRLNRNLDGARPFMNLQGVAFADGFLSPRDYAVMWADKLWNIGYISLQQKTKFQTMAEKCVQTETQKGFAECIIKLQLQMLLATECVSILNVEKRCQSDIWSVSLRNQEPYLHDYYNRELSPLMNGPIHDKLHIPNSVYWSGQAEMVRESLKAEMLEPKISYVEKILQDSGLIVCFYTGTLDLAVPVTGVELSVSKLNWTGSEHFEVAPRFAFHDDHGNLAGWIQKYKNLNFYWVKHAGHEVPKDNPEAALALAKLILQQSHN